MKFDSMEKEGLEADPDHVAVSPMMWQKIRSLFAEADRSWARVFGANCAEFRELIEAGKHTLLDPYGATAPAEFFAVATETFLRSAVCCIRNIRNPTMS